jgi:aldehyde:ferredoxin oxidoreductase
LPYFQEPELHQNPYLDRRYGLDRAQFEPVLDAFYQLHGWDERGWPTEARLRELGLEDVYEDMIDGAVQTATGAERS